MLPIIILCVTVVGGGYASVTTTVLPKTSSSNSSILNSSSVTDKTISTQSNTTMTIQDLNTHPSTNGSPVTTLRPLFERQCLPGVVCVHGVCDHMNFPCRCDPGWRVPFCDIKDSITENESTQDSNATTEPTTLNNEDAHTTPSSLTDDNALLLTMPDDWEPLEGHGPLPPLHLRTCSGIPNFVCRYGNCSMDEGLRCVCDPSFKDTFCNVPCTLECGDWGHCQFNYAANGSAYERCYCKDHSYQGDNCTYVEPWIIQSDSLSDGQIAAVVVVSVLTVCLIVILLVMYCLWRRRNITIMRVVYWFKSFEEDDERKYDAFVSYAPSETDEKFLMEDLIPCLEKDMGFSLCIQQRDLLASRYMSENIRESVEQSRRTIMLVSASYVGSEWCQFEFQMALQEMISQKHRLIPIVIDDISELTESIDTTMKKVLNVVTLIRYPGQEASQKSLEKFWKRMYLSMPKKRETSSDPSAQTGQSPSDKPTTPSPFMTYDTINSNSKTVSSDSIDLHLISPVPGVTSSGPDASKEVLSSGMKKPHSEENVYRF